MSATQSRLDQFAAWFGLSLSITAVVAGLGLSTFFLAAFINQQLLIPNGWDRFTPNVDDWPIAGIPAGGCLGLLLAIRFHHRMWLHVLGILSVLFVASVFVWVVNLKGFLAKQIIAATVPPLVVMLAVSAGIGAVAAAGILVYRKRTGRVFTFH